MMPRHADQVAQVGAEDMRYLREYFSAGPGEIGCALAARGCCQADVVLALLVAGRLRAAEVVVGRPVQALPPDPRLSPAPLPSPSAGHGCCADGRRVLRVAKNPRLPTTPAFQRYRVIRVGLTIAQLLRRGVTRRDLRQMVGAGYVELS